MNDSKEKLCPNCNSLLNYENESFICDYCDSKFSELDLENIKNNIPITSDITIDKVTRYIPFTKTKNDLLNEVKRITKGKIFIPSIFKRIREEDIKLQYVPFYIFDIKSEGDTNLKCTDIVSKVKDENKIINIKKYKTTINSKVDFAKIQVCANNDFDKKNIEGINEFDFNNLSDIPTDLDNTLETNITYNESLKIVYKKCRKLINDLVMKKTEHKYSVINSNNIKYDLINAELVYLPILYVEINYLNNKYYLKMNGESGELDLDIPISNERMFILTTLVFLITVLIASLIFFLGGAK
ncbi:MAG: hypothetical protein IJS56_01415 [Bacilli bacterium]|nr:hypothetical protein [Bacilli bacterium]